MNFLESFVEAYCESLQQTIDVQKKELTEKDQVINEKDQVIDEKDQTISRITREKDQEILKLKEKLAALEAEKAQN